MDRVIRYCQKSAKVKIGEKTKKKKNNIATEWKKEIRCNEIYIFMDCARNLRK